MIFIQTNDKDDDDNDNDDDNNEDDHNNDDNDDNDEDDLGQDANDRSLSGMNARQNRSKTCQDHHKHVGFL